MVWLECPRLDWKSYCKPAAAAAERQGGCNCSSSLQESLKTSSRGGWPTATAVLGSCCSCRVYTLSVSAGEETGEQVSKLEVNPLHKMDVLH